MTSVLELDRLIEEITVDCYNDAEQLTAFECAFQEIELPVPGTVVGEEVTVLAIGLPGDRWELVATCQRGDHRYDVCLQDVEIRADAPLADLLAAYRRWRRHAVL